MWEALPQDRAFELLSQRIPPRLQVALDRIRYRITWTCVFVLAPQLNFLAIDCCRRFQLLPGNDICSQGTQLDGQPIHSVLHGDFYLAVASGLCNAEECSWNSA